MKKFILFCLSLGFLVLLSCEQDPCRDVLCGAQGSCDEGSGACICNTGYEQDSTGQCNIEMRAKFIGNYSLSETCGTGMDNYNCEITASSQGIMKIVFSNLYDASIAVPADLQSSTTFTIPAGTPLGTGTISGTGEYNSATNQVTLSYTFTDVNGSDDSCNATLTPL